QRQRDEAGHGQHQRRLEEKSEWEALPEGRYEYVVHRWSPFRASSTSREIRSSSESVKLSLFISSRAATAASVEPPKKVRNTFRIADSFAASRGTVALYTYRGPSCSCSRCPFSSRIRIIALTAE